MKNFFYVLKDPDKVKKEDLTLSFLRSLAEVQGHLAHVHALAHQVRKVYFIGGFINMELMRRYLYQEINGRNFARPEVKKNLTPTTKSTIICTLRGMNIICSELFVGRKREKYEMINGKSGMRMRILLADVSSDERYENVMKNLSHLVYWILVIGKRYLLLSCHEFGIDVP